MYRDMPLNERLERIGELLAKGVYLCVKKKKYDKKKVGCLVYRGPSVSVSGFVEPDD